MKIKHFYLSIVLIFISFPVLGQFGDFSGYYQDADGDGYGNPIVGGFLSKPGWVTNNLDCNDNNRNIYPGASEILDGKDNNCNGQIDEGLNIAIPSAPSIIERCGFTQLIRGTPPVGIKWYWQSSPFGIETSPFENEINFIDLINGSTHYLRARHIGTGKWSKSRIINYNIKVIPKLPSTPSVVNNCGNSKLTKGSSPIGVTWYWQSSPSGKDTSNSIASITRTIGSVYYLRARNNSLDCWSSVRTVSYSIKSMPGSPSVPTVVNNCGNTKLTKGSSPSGVTWYWQSSSDGTSTLNSSASITRDSGSVYYLKARHNTTGCWSSVRTVSYSVKLIPSVPTTPNVVNNCDSSVLTKGSQPSGVTWYWQSSSSGKDTSNLRASITRTSGSVYYLRARNDSTGCWGSSRSVNYTIKTAPTWYVDTDSDGYGNPASTKSACTQPVGFVANASDYDDTTNKITNIAPQRFYLDADNDGFGDPNNSVYCSVKPSGYVSNNTDQCPTQVGVYSGCEYLKPVFSNENYVFTRIYKKGMTSSTSTTSNKDVSESITYFDGLGRAKQSVAIRTGGVLTSSEIPKDIITHYEYDALGRQIKEYLPYARATNNGSIITGDVAIATTSYYQTKHNTDFAGVPLPDVNAYSEKQYDNSPLNRVLKQAAPGDAWKLGSGHEIKFDYQTNVLNEVKIFEVTTIFANNTYTPSLIRGSSFYDAGKLYKTVTKDENWKAGLNHTTEEFKNKEGQVILKRTYNESKKHDTYYVYDDFGNLTYVLPPKIDVSEAANTLAVIQTKLNDLGYQYKYDHRNRLVEKKIPGKGIESIVYDKLDRPVLTQDKIQQASRKWLFTKYDILGRVVYTGIYTHATVINRQTMQTYFNNQNLQNTVNAASKMYEEQLTVPGALEVYYSNANFPNTNSEVLTINYYDNYVFYKLRASENSYGIPFTSRVKGLATGSRVKVLETNSWVTTITYYDEKARPIYVFSINDLLSTIDILESKIDAFTGKVLETKTTHKKAEKGDIITVDRFEYDHMDRLISQTQKINNQKEQVLVESIYDELGQLKNKGVGGETTQNRLQTVDYKYNVRGWLKNINEDGLNDKDLFNFTINYNEPEPGATPLFNGNISQTSWSTLSADKSAKTYSYNYDALNRIINATGVLSDKYNVTGVQYDKNGNIKNLQRNGFQDSDNFIFMDDLYYGYDSGNKLVRVFDHGNRAFGFKDKYDATNTLIEYTYDVNGNMKTDANKGITNITYNHLNLPTQVTIGGKNIDYTYDAAGIKLSKTVNGVTTQYAGNYVYENNVLQFFNHSEGYVKPVIASGSAAISSFDYVYQYKDHLGNVRLSYTDNNNDGVIQTDGTNSEIVEESNYYPFGLKHKGYNNNISSIGNSTAQKWNFLGQESNEELGLNWLTFRYRNYDAAIGRFFGVDPVSEDYMSISTYQFAHNNPVWKIELEGLEGIPINGFDVVNSEPVRGHTNAIPIGDGVRSHRTSQPVNKQYSSINNFDSSSNTTYTWGSSNLSGNNVFGTPRNVNCANLATAQANDLGTSLLGQGSTGEVTYTNMIEVYNSETDELFNSTEAIDYINSELESGNAVVVGIDDGDSGGTDSRGTDHYVTIVGRDSKEISNSGKKGGDGFFFFIENAVGDPNDATDFSVNRLYPSTGNSNLSGNTVWGNRTYQTTRVQKNENDNP